PPRNQFLRHLSLSGSDVLAPAGALCPTRSAIRPIVRGDFPYEAGRRGKPRPLRGDAPDGLSVLTGMGRLPESPVEVRLAATLFLLLLGLANVFGAWQVKNFSAFTPRGVAATFRTEMPSWPESHAGHQTMISERPVTAEDINAPRHRIDRELLVQD